MSVESLHLKSIINNIINCKISWTKIDWGNPGQEGVKVEEKQKCRWYYNSPGTIHWTNLPRLGKHWNYIQQLHRGCVIHLTVNKVTSKAGSYKTSLHHGYSPMAKLNSKLGQCSNVGEKYNSTSTETTKLINAGIPYKLYLKFIISLAKMDET